MANSLNVREDAVRGEEHGLGLGWLLGIALGGAVLLFLAIGLLLAWRIKSRSQPCTTRVYSMSDLPDENGRVPPTRLSKRRLLASEYSMSRFSSRLSLSLPPILPPLPTYNSVALLGNRGRSRSWVDEDTLHGPKMNRNVRESWFSMDTWFGRTPTLPSLDPADVEKATSRDDAAQERPQEPRQEIVVQKRQSRPALQTSQTAPVLPTQGEPQRGRSRAPAQTHVRPSMTDTGLRDILHMTEQRLRDGTSRSPTKTPRGSPSKSSPTKTPRSCRTVSSHGTVRIRGTPSPSKRIVQHVAATPKTNSRNASISSIGSAANSLIREATEQLELPGGMSSPSRLRGTEWQQPAEDQSVQQLTKTGRRSVDSDVSSSLSTLYSMEEPEESNSGGQNQANDPFVEKEIQVPIPVPERNPLRRRTQTMSAANLIPRGADQSVIPAPLRPLSVNSQLQTRRNTVKMNWKLPIVLHPPTRPASEEVGPKSPTALKQRVPSTPSEVSMVTDTVHSDSEPDLPPVNKSKAEASPGSREKSQTPRPSTPDGSNTSTDMSSPYDEQDILSLLLSSSQPRRALPRPPRLIDGANDVGTALSPRPKTSAIARHVRKASVASISSSNYSDPAAVSTGSPPRRNSSSKDTEANTVGNTIAQLRRMNSIVSSYSVASIASTVTIVGADAESPSLPSLRSGNLSPTRSSHKIGKAIGSRHYLNVGTARTHSRGAASRDRRSGNWHLRQEGQDHGKENVGLGLRTIRGGEGSASGGLREGRRSGNLGRDAAGASKTKLGPVDELVVEDRRHAEQRESVESLGLYDKDGFLITSPEREIKIGRLRM